LRLAIAGKEISLFIDALLAGLRIRSSANFVGSVVGFLNVLVTCDLQVIRLVTFSLPPLMRDSSTYEFQFTAFLKFEFHYRRVIL
jgi:hypothetical protein